MTEKKGINQKLFELQKLGISIPKNGEIAGRGKYVLLDDLIEGYKKPMNERDLLVIHKSEGNKIITQIIDVESGEYVESHLEHTMTEPQKVGAWITYAKRYNLGQLLNIVTNEDDDGESTVEKPNVRTLKEYLVSLMPEDGMTREEGMKRAKEYIESKTGEKYEFDDDKKAKEILLQLKSKK